jgi:hypothetical protein
MHICPRLATLTLEQINSAYVAMHIATACYVSPDLLAYEVVMHVIPKLASANTHTSKQCIRCSAHELMYAVCLKTAFTATSSCW